MLRTRKAASGRSAGRRRTARTAAAAGAVVIAAAGAGLSTAGVAHADGHGVGSYGVWGTNVNVRWNNSEWCSLYPSTANCPTVRDRVSHPESVWVYCQQEGGQTVGGNPYWVWVLTPRGERGYMASYYISNVTNWIDGVPLC
ncbi:hypothetical protein [Streptomyces fulvoviolaceus]|uniref:hypothetical protein n=1 Tax=Streptomyces fulvoviolaceus TaxID=285535 RepID=UPI0021C1CF35|nr:hypothetical protein [Streptomyces fulvoviolaceus]MCT9081533.1 hypothetical protein [Streptomyces fulvoviolaceus]